MFRIWTVIQLFLHFSIAQCEDVNVKVANQHKQKHSSLIGKSTQTRQRSKSQFCRKVFRNARIYTEQVIAEQKHVSNSHMLEVKL